MNKLELIVRYAYDHHFWLQRGQMPVHDDWIGIELIRKYDAREAAASIRRKRVS